MLASLALPISAHELRDALRHARRFDTARLDRVLSVDARQDVVEVQSSATWDALGAHLRCSEIQLPQAWDGAATIGESLAENRPGPDGRPVVTHVKSVALVTPDGEIRRLSRESNAELFALAVGGQGLFGAPYSITLALQSLLCAAQDCVPAATLDLPRGPARGRPLRLLVPPEALERFIAEARERCREWHTAIESVEVGRTLPEEETFLRWARREYAALTLLLAERRSLGGSVRSTQLRRELIDSAIDHGGSFPISCTPEATREQTQSCYPELQRFMAEKRRVDPMEKLVNPWYRHYRSLLGRESCEVRWGREG
jgi:hypothetical protein